MFYKKNTRCSPHLSGFFVTLQRNMTFNICSITKGIVEVVLSINERQNKQKQIKT